MGSNLSAAVGAMLKDTNFFLLIEDYGYSKSRTKIGMSVDIKVWEETQKLCGIKMIHSQIFDPFTVPFTETSTDASNMCERIRISMSDPIQLIELHIGKW